MKSDYPLIFVVEDDEGIQEVYEGALEDSYRVRLLGSGEEFFKAYEQEHPDLIILDIMLPDTDGYTILSDLRKRDVLVPVIIVSAKSDEISFVKGLNKGADDYVSKPFSVLELLARVKANLRRANLYVTESAGFSVDKNTYKIYYHGDDLKLTMKEYSLMKILIEKAGITVTREELFQRVWGDNFIGESRTLDMHMATLREKMKLAGSDDRIVTVRGIGYRFEAL